MSLTNAIFVPFTQRSYPRRERNYDISDYELALEEWLHWLEEINTSTRRQRLSLFSSTLIIRSYLWRGGLSQSQQHSQHQTPTLRPLVPSLLSFNRLHLSPPNTTPFLTCSLRFTVAWYCYTFLDTYLTTYLYALTWVIPSTFFSHWRICIQPPDLGHKHLWIQTCKRCGHYLPYLCTDPFTTNSPAAIHMYMS